MATVISLSTIPPRFSKIGASLQSLVGQIGRTEDVRLYIPRHYRRFPDWDGVLPEVPDGVAICRCEVDFGPATKVLPAARDLYGHGARILFCDDDRIYDREWLGRFEAAARQRPDTCIVEIGENFPDIADDCRHPDRLPRSFRPRKDWRYRLMRIATLALYKPPLIIGSGYVDQICGCGGVLVRPEWFAAAAYDIPDVMWTVDDPWLSGHLELAGVPIWLNGDRRSSAATVREAHDSNSLMGFVEGGCDRVAADLMVIDYFRRVHGIWKKGGRPKAPWDQINPTMLELMRRRVQEILLEGMKPRDS